MYICACFVAAGAVLYLICIRKGVRKTWGIYALILMISGGMGLLLAVNSQKEQAAVSDDTIRRPEPGSGEIEQEYELQVDDLEIHEPYRIVVENRHLTRQELEALFEQAAEEVEQIFLGENKSMDRITHPVELPSDVLDGRVSVNWTLDNYEAVNLNGELQRDALTEQGTLVAATATLEYEGAEAIHSFSFMVYPPEQSPMEAFYDRLGLLLADENASTEAVFGLPQTVDGHRVVWSRVPQKGPYQMLGLGIVSIIGIMIGRREDERRQRQQRREQLLAEYPQMLGQLALLIGAGMTVGYAWERLVRNYEEQVSQGVHAGRAQPLYEEMCTTYHQIRDGMSERLAYEQFGERLQLSVYRRFSTLLVQNLRKGTAGFSSLLEKEMQQALDAQESDIKKRGEELQTKLLLPMMLMLGLVVVIIMIPAMASFQL